MRDRLVRGSLGTFTGTVVRLGGLADCGRLEVVCTRLVGGCVSGGFVLFLEFVMSLEHSCLTVVVIVVVRVFGCFSRDCVYLLINYDYHGS